MKYDTIPSLKRGALDKIVKEYLPLVDHDTDKAMIFFKKAYDVDDDTERYIREGIKDYPLFNNNID